MELARFLYHLRRSRLLPEEQVRDVTAEFPHAAAPALAGVLAARGLLTEYQADQLLRGNAKGFLLGPYRILDYLGQGGLACVFRAMHTLMERVVALKVLTPSGPPANPSDLELLRWEARALARLSHPNIIAAHDAGQAKRSHYLVLEYADGPSLRRLARCRGPLAVGLACSLARQVAAALQHAHERGVTHCDVKPANILVVGLPGRCPPEPGGNAAPARLAGAPTVKLLDFGLARLAGTDARLAAEQAAVERALGEVCGTPEFMSPEQARGGAALDGRSDLYSLGCTLYYALAGRPPFSGTTAAEILIKHGIDEPEPLGQQRRDVPSALWDVVRRLLAKDPGDRFSTAAEVGQALDPWCGTPAELPPLACGKTWSGSEHETGQGWESRPKSRRPRIAGQPHRRKTAGPTPDANHPPSKKPDGHLGSQ